MTRALALTLALVALSLPAAAQQPRYVDAVSGSDANDGTSPTSAWKTLTRAATSGRRIIEVAPGLYDASNGEQFPLRYRRSARIRGAEGVVIDAGGAPIAIEFRPIGNSQADSLLEDLEIRSAVIGVLQPVDIRLSVVNCEVHSCDIGLHDPTDGPGSWIDVWESHVHDCRIGVLVEGVARLGVLRSVITDIQEYGIDQSNGAPAAQDLLYVDQTRIQRCGLDGIRVRDFGDDLTRVSVLHSVITDNDSAIRTTGTTSTSQLDLLIEYTTLAGNRVGLKPEVAPTSTVTLRRSILGANVHDFLPLPPVIVTDQALIEGGAYSSRPDVIQGDPRFVDPAAGDYRLRWDSPAIDQGPVEECRTGRRTVDSGLGTVSADGDYDLLNEHDLGGYEFETLGGPLDAPVSSPIEFEVRALPGTLAVLAVADTPAGNQIGWLEGQYGCLGLSRFGLRRIAAVPIPNNGDPAIVSVPPSSIGAIAGTSRWFQAVLQSPVAPFNWAMSSRVEVRFVP